MLTTTLAPCPRAWPAEPRLPLCASFACCRPRHRVLPRAVKDSRQPGPRHVAKPVASPRAPAAAASDEAAMRFYGCYLLQSLHPRGKNRTYIGARRGGLLLSSQRATAACNSAHPTSRAGFTVNPLRRIRQHNGEVSNGAHRTRAWRPWETVLVVHGFPTKARDEMVVYLGCIVALCGTDTACVCIPSMGMPACLYSTGCPCNHAASPTCRIMRNHPRSPLPPPPQIHALQFEWAWQHPTRSLAARSVAARIGTRGMQGAQGRVRLLVTGGGGRGVGRACAWGCAYTASVLTSQSLPP